MHCSPLVFYVSSILSRASTGFDPPKVTTFYGCTRGSQLDNTGSQYTPCLVEVVVGFFAVPFTHMWNILRDGDTVLLDREP